MPATSKNGKYFWLMNLLVIALVLISLVLGGLNRAQDSEYLVRLFELPHYVKSDGMTDAAEVAAGVSVNAESAALPFSERRTFMLPGRHPNREFTISVSFDYTAGYDALMSNISPGAIPALYIRGLGDSFQIHLNDTLIASEWHVDGEKITIHKWENNTAYPFSPDLLIRGVNTLTYRIYGDPTTYDTGLTISDKYVIDDLSRLPGTDYSQTVFVGLYAAVAGTFFLLSLLYKQKKQNLWFALSALSMCLYTLIKTNAGKSLIPDYEWLFRVESLTLFSFVYFVILLIYSCRGEKLNRPMKAATILYAVFSVAVFLPGHQFQLDLVSMNLMLFSALLVYTFLSSMYMPLARDTRAEIKRGNSGLKFLASELSLTLRGNMAVSATFPILFALIDGIDYILHSFQSVFLSRFGFLFFFANMTLALASEISEMHNQLRLYSAELQARTNELHAKTAEALRAQEAKSEFISTVSRELRRPVNEMIGASELAVIRGDMPESARQTLRQIGAAAKALLRNLSTLSGEQSDEKASAAEDYGKYFANRHTIDEPAKNIKNGGTHHFFVINPKSFVTKTDLKNFLLGVEKCFSVGHRAEYKVFVSRYPRDASATVHRYISGVSSDTTVRVYAVGGDGIAFDCLNGMAKHKNAELALIPYGNSNDICRSFGEENMHLFRDIKRMSKSPAQPVDVIECGALYALSSCSIGIEACAVRKFDSIIKRVNTGSTRRFVPIIYNLGAIVSLLDGSASGMHYRMTIDGEDFSGGYLLINCGNMPHNGGSNTPNPLAVPNDGLLDVVTYKQRSVLHSLVVMPSYTKGRFAGFPGLLVHRRFKELHCECDSQFAVILDGETFYTNKISLKVMPGAIRLVSPDGISFSDYSYLAERGSKR